MIQPHDFKIGDRVRSLRTGEIGVIFQIRAATLNDVRMPDIVFIETDHEKHTGIVSEPGALVHVKDS